MGFVLVLLLYGSHKKLEQNNWVEKSGHNPWPRPGKKQYYYKATQQGLELLIGDDPPYCHHTDLGLSAKNLNQLYNMLKEKYLTYRNHSFSTSISQLDIIDNMRDKLLDSLMITTN